MNGCPVYDMEGKRTGEVAVPQALGSLEVSPHLVWQVVVGQERNRRAGTASTRTRAETRGGGRKPWRQKGTGRARHGSTRSPIWVGGGKVGTPRPREYAATIPRRLRRLALSALLKHKLAENRLVVVEPLSLDKISTKAAAQALESVGAVGRVLLLVEKKDATWEKSCANLKNVTWLLRPHLSARELQAADTLVCGRETAEHLFGECAKWITPTR